MVKIKQSGLKADINVDALSEARLSVWDKQRQENSDDTMWVLLCLDHAIADTLWGMF